MIVKKWNCWVIVIVHIDNIAKLPSKLTIQIYTLPLMTGEEYSNFFSFSLLWPFPHILKNILVEAVFNTTYCSMCHNLHVFLYWTILPFCILYKKLKWPLCYCQYFSASDHRYIPQHPKCLYLIWLNLIFTELVKGISLHQHNYPPFLPTPLSSASVLFRTYSNALEENSALQGVSSACCLLSRWLSSSSCKSY